MSNAVAEQGSTTAKVIPRLGALPKWIGDVVPPALFALRMWASVCLALYIAFALEVQNPWWAGGSAALVAQPQLGASLRKGWFRMIGTAIGAIMVVVITALFPQDRIGFLGLLALWCGLCVFAASLLRNFASYSASLAGYTAAIAAANILGATGGASTEAFMVAVWRASEICIGIVSAGLVLALTDLGGAQRRLAQLVADLSTGIVGGFLRMLETAGPGVPDTQPERREFARRVIALDPAVDLVIGESSHVRYHAPTLQRAVHGLFAALVGWRGVATHLSRSQDEIGREAVQTILRTIPPELESARESDSARRWMADPMNLRRLCDKAVRMLIALPAGTPALRLITNETAKVLAGMVEVFDGLALLVDAPDQPLPARDGFRLTVPDYLPALINGVRAFVMIAAVELFWVATAWPNGAFPIVLVAIGMLLISPKGDVAYFGSITFVIGSVGGLLSAALLKFAVLPAFQTFPAFCFALGLFFLPVGFMMAKSRNLAVVVICTGMAASLLPLLTPTNEMTYDTQKFYNLALAIVVGSGIAPVAFKLIPPLSPAFRTRRLLAFALRDLRRLAIAPLPPTLMEWESRMFGRHEALPDSAQPLERAELLAAFSVGCGIIELRRMSAPLGAGVALDAALTAFAQGNSALARTRLTRLDDDLASRPDSQSLNARASILVLSEALASHSSYFDAGAPV
jgi:uncharacterized membrane protein YccC